MACWVSAFIACFVGDAGCKVCTDLVPNVRSRVVALRCLCWLIDNGNSIRRREVEISIGSLGRTAFTAQHISDSPKADSHFEGQIE